jgi:5'-nucleotidase
MPPHAVLPLEAPLRPLEAPADTAPRSDVSPAVDLAEVAQTAASSTPTAPINPAPQPLDWAHIAPPPALPASFAPAAEPAPKSNWQPSRLPAPTALHAARPPAQPRTYRLRDGDTLERIAERFLGNAERAAEIFETNRAVLARPDLLPVGATIQIPPREAALDLEPVAAADRP